tara:strand:+ start:1015 stop:1827 length:813 start_codon:yes stop_codon:yes gene_type:complete
MERSGSRVTWQIAKQLAPEAPPDDWYPEWQNAVYNYHVPGGKDELPRDFINWPLRGHEYYPDIPVIYTYRNPTEALLSLYSRMCQDVGKTIPGPTGKKFEMTPGVWLDEQSWDNAIVMTKDIAMKRALYSIGKHWDIWKRYSAEAKEGREVLFLRYEDHFADHGSRVKAIADFMKSSATLEELFQISEDTSLEKNLRLSESISKNNPDARFGVGFLGKTGLQLGHVNPNIKGIPGLHLETQPRLVGAVKNAQGGPLEALREMTIDMGYEL